MMSASNDLVPALGSALLQFLWQGLLIGALTGAALYRLRRATPEVRYVVVCLGLLSCLLVPLIDVLARLYAPALVHVIDFPALIKSAMQQTDSLRSSNDAAVRSPDVWLSGVVIVWAIGCTVLCLRTLFGLVWVERLRHAAHHRVGAPWQARVDRLAVRFGLTRHIELRVMDLLGTPFTTGFLRPLVVIPSALLASMPIRSVEALIAHELAHIRRHDYLVNFVQRLIEAVLFYHPVTWWLSRRIRIERELIADAMAAQVLGAPRDVAKALSELAELQHHVATPVLAQAAAGGALVSRVRALVSPGHQPASAMPWVLVFVAVLTAGLASHAYARLDIGPIMDTNTTNVAHTDVAARRDTYVLVYGDGRTRGFGPEDDVGQIAAARRVFPGEFLWVHRAGRAYIIDDPQLLSRAQAAWFDVDAMEMQIARLHSNQDYSASTEALARESEEAADIAAERLRHLTTEALVSGRIQPAPAFTPTQ